jgi:hypothetical protein
VNERGHRNFRIGIRASRSLELEVRLVGEILDIREGRSIVRSGETVELLVTLEGLFLVIRIPILLLFLLLVVLVLAETLERDRAGRDGLFVIVPKSPDGCIGGVEFLGDPSG